MLFFTPDVTLRPDFHRIEADERRRSHGSDWIDLGIVLHRIEVNPGASMPAYLIAATIDGTRQRAVQLCTEAWESAGALITRSPAPIYRHCGPERAFVDTRVLLVGVPGGVRPAAEVEAAIRASKGFATIERALVTVASLHFPAVCATAVLGDCLISLIGTVLALAPRCQIGYLAACLSRHDGLQNGRRVVPAGAATFDFEVQLKGQRQKAES